MDESTKGCKHVAVRQRPDRGYFPEDKHNWWFDANEPNAFQIFDLDGFYPEEYFHKEHVQPLAVKFLCYALLARCQKILGRDVQSVLDLGSGSGQFAETFQEAGVETVAVEGSEGGVARMVERGLDPSAIVRHDLRRPLRLARKFDVVLCTEVAEHIEPPFSSQLLCAVSEHSDICWFSSEPPGGNRPHMHHPNEQPDIFWINLARFYGFEACPLRFEYPDALAGDDGEVIRQELYGRGRYLLVRRSLNPIAGPLTTRFVIRENGMVGVT